MPFDIAVRAMPAQAAPAAPAAAVVVAERATYQPLARARPGLKRGGSGIVGSAAATPERGLSVDDLLDELDGGAAKASDSEYGDVRAALEDDRLRTTFK